MTAAASLSSVSDSNRCSSVAYSWRRSLAKRQGAVQRLFETAGKCRHWPIPFPSCTAEGAVVAGEVHDLRHLRLRHFESIDPADADALLVDMQHDAGRLLASLAEEPLEHVHDEFHRRVVVVEQQHLVQRRLLGLRLRAGNDPCLILVSVVRLLRHECNYIGASPGKWRGFSRRNSGGGISPGWWKGRWASLSGQALPGSC